MRSELPPTCGLKSRGHPTCAAAIRLRVRPPPACQGSTLGERVTTGLGPRVSRLWVGLGCEGVGWGVGDKRLRQGLRMGSDVQGLGGSGNTEVFVLLGKRSLCPSPVRVHERLVDSRRVEGRVGVGATAQHGAHRLKEVRRGSGLVIVNTGVLRRRAYRVELTGPGRWICLD